MEWAEESLVNAHQAIQAKDVRLENNLQTHACQIHVGMVLNVSHKEVISCANVHLDFQVNVAKIKCKPIHANQTHVKTEACA